VIGISVGRLPPGRRDRDGADHDYGAAVVLAGGSPVLLPATAGSDAEAVTARIDGLLLSGGGDVDPARYGDSASPATRGVDGVRDGVEVELLRGALARDLPVLAICRGAQLLNVALGGTLHQHLPDVTGVDHLHPEPRSFLAHRVKVEAGSILRQVVGVDQFEVNSMHHQAVDALAPGLRVGARAPDGIVEAVEDPDRRLLGVQWHPENLAAAGGAHLALFAWLTRPWT
jgi:gamma-glutamyl-gamma-aminobutyrate hydrolase PuuD